MRPLCGIQAAAAEVHTLPDGQSLTIEGEGQQLAQAIVHPIMLKKDLPDLPAATVTQIMQHPDGATRKVCYVLPSLQDRMSYLFCFRCIANGSTGLVIWVIWL